MRRLFLVATIFAVTLVAPLALRADQITRITVDSSTQNKMFSVLKRGSRVADNHLRCPAVTGDFCDNLSHVCCRVNGVDKCCPSLSSDCCKE